MANILFYNPSSRRVERYLKGIDPKLVVRRDDVLIDPDVSGVDLKFAKVKLDNTVRNMTVDEKEAYIEAQYRVLYEQFRAGEYPPITDQIEILLKQLDIMNKGGTIQLIPELDNLINYIKSVKLKYPKPL